MLDIHMLSFMSLTFRTDDLGSVPFAVSTAFGGGDVALDETVCALVTHHRVYVVVRTFPANNKGVVHSRWRSTQH